MSGCKYYLIKRLQRSDVRQVSQYDNMTLDKLKTLCKDRGRPTNGIKEDLICELMDYEPVHVKVPTLVKVKRRLTSMLSHLKTPKDVPKVKSTKYFEVKNAVKTSNDKIEVSWLTFWSTHTSLEVGQCSILSCKSKATCGGHLTYKYNQRRHYIAPICSFHNGAGFNNKYSFLKYGTFVVSIAKKKHREY